MLTHCGVKNSKLGVIEVATFDRNGYLNNIKYLIEGYNFVFRYPNHIIVGPLVTVLQINCLRLICFVSSNPLKRCIK